MIVQENMFRLISRLLDFQLKYPLIIKVCSHFANAQLRNGQLTVANAPPLWPTSAGRFAQVHVYARRPIRNVIS